MAARFYDNFHPEHYDLYLDVNRATKDIQGQTTITGEALSSEIKLHQKYLQIQQVQVNGQTADYQLDEKNEAVIVSSIEPGSVQIKIQYQAPLTDTMMGIYPSYYQVDGVEKQIVGTQFETTAARQAFPCVDEPAAKATFSLAIKFDEHDGETVISNMPEDHVAQGIHYFATTVKMSTYLVAFAFGELQGQFTKTASGVQVGVFATKAHLAKELTFAVDIAKRAIEFYEDFYQTPYPLPQSLQLALPDFSAGAMENWGLVTYRETCLLLDPDNASLDTKEYVATVIAHELAHQWFGDLVTMQWWDDLWLNESFANMMEYVAIDALEPEWHVWELFQTAEVPAALQRDATDGVQPVHVQVEHPAEIDSIFDSAIVYAKGARMLVMVRSLIGDQALRQGLKNYFQEHQFGNAIGQDLWQALGQAAQIDLATIMQTWLEQPGYPVVHAQIQDGHLILNQEQFFIGNGQTNNRQWQIPLQSNFAQVPALMTESRLDLGDYQTLRAQEQQPFRLNIGNKSHFIVDYDATLLAEILADVDRLDAITQRQLLHDLALLAEAQQVAYADVLVLLPKFVQSHSSIVNAMLYQILGQLKKFVQDDAKATTQLQQLYQQLSAPAAKRLTWQAQDLESNDDELTRPDVLQAALYGQNADIIEQGHQIVQQNMAHLGALPAATRALLLANEVQNYNSSALMARLLDLYQTASDGSLKQDLAYAVTKTTQKVQIERLIQLFQNSKVIKPQDLRTWYNYLLKNSDGQQLAWDWLRTNWLWLAEKLGGDMEFTTYITVTANAFATDARLKEFEEFFTPKVEIPGLGREIKMDIQAIQARVQLVSAEQTAVQTTIKKLIG
ncbi:M1 family metallopeptidase [Bombilactobacillus folatiphilus]|uniref:Aminopeptidase n=1 Tax=Bombilactobacillus folatiphilus TaxID=2923362 RepID=A0ABY4PA05_9LACO|nr:M1 family metallopeptidase [Bombilactobacillus folatiphilus]UQS82508.1 M1 family metallopeptidase [Bombilactobacillus folatiphilus]